jgi:integrase
MESTTALAVPSPSLPALPVAAAAHADPAAVYLAALAEGSRRAMQGSLDSIAKLFPPLPEDMPFPWHLLRREHTQAIRAALGVRAPATANKMLAALRGVLREAWRLELMDAEQYQRAVDLKGFKGSRLPAGRMLETGELRALFASCAREGGSSARLDAALLALLVGGGLRRAEAVDLKLDDYNASTGELRVRGKGDRERLVHVTNGTADALAAWLDVRGLEAGPLFVPVHRSGSIKELRKMTPQAILARFARRAESTGVRAFSPHDLRRSFVSALLDAGADVSAVQRLAGHANVATTMRYDRRGEQAKRKAAELVHVPFVAFASAR